MNSPNFTWQELDGKTVEFEIQGYATEHGRLKAFRYDDGSLGVRIEQSSLGEMSRHEPVTDDAELLQHHPRHRRADFLWAQNDREVMANMY